MADRVRAQYHMLPELYATPWFITLFARRLPFPVVYALWDAYIVEGDPLLHYFAMIALLIDNKAVLMKVAGQPSRGSARCV